MIFDLTLTFLLFLHSCCGQYTQPEQIHLSYGRDPTTQMMVTWSTMDDTQTSVVKFGSTSQKPEKQVTGGSKLFVDPGPQHRKQYIHRVLLSGLAPGQKYYYMCGSKQGWSQEFSFTTMMEGDNWSPRLVMFGDMGDTNAQSIPRLLTNMDTFDAVLHVGDFAYDMDTNDSLVGDAFMNKIQNIAAYKPYMTCPGNHENNYNFSNYKNRFTMPTDENADRMFYSFDIGPAHIISFSTEYYYYIKYGVWQLYNQYEWIKKDLEKANLPENRAKRPWIITMGHRPMYCSNEDNDDCTRKNCLVRVGVPLIHIGGLEPLFDKYGVDLAIWAHEHSYERMWPIYDYEVHNGSSQYPYTNPGAPVHITTGSAGCKERHDPFKKTAPYWSAYRNLDYGFTHMTIHNHTHITVQQLSDDKNGTVVDKFTLIKDKHGPYGFGQS